MVRMRMVFLYSEPLQEALQRIERHNASISAFISAGPSGGNPEFFLDFPSRGEAMALWKEMNPDDDDALILQHIEEL